MSLEQLLVGYLTDKGYIHPPRAARKDARRLPTVKTLLRGGVFFFAVYPHDGTRIQRMGDVGGKEEARVSSPVCSSRLYSVYSGVREGQCEILFAELSDTSLSSAKSICASRGAART